MFKKDDKVIYNEAKASIHHIGTIVEVTGRELKVEFVIDKDNSSFIYFPLNGYDKMFNRQLKLVEGE